MADYNAKIEKEWYPVLVTGIDEWGKPTQLRFKANISANSIRRAWRHSFDNEQYTIETPELVLESLLSTRHLVEPEETAEEVFYRRYISDPVALIGAQ